MVQNFETEKVSPLIRPLVWAAGAMAPDGKAPFHYRLALKWKRQAAAEAGRRLLAFAPERVIFAHGRWFEQDGTRLLRQSLGWLVD
jgi:hypothetical protein